MATESPIQIVEASGIWGSTHMGIEDLGLVLTDQRFQGRKSNLAPYRSGSAPPSIESSFAAIDNLMFRQNLATDANLAIPNHTGENQNFFRNVRGTGSNRRLASFDDTSSRSLWLDHGNLSTHKEESDDDRSPKQDLPQTQSPASNQSHPFIQGPNEKAGNHTDCFSTTTNVSSPSSIDDIGGNMVIKPPMSTSLNTPSQDHGSVSGIADAHVSAIQNGIISLNVSNIPILENEIDWRQRNPLTIHAAPQHPIVSLPQTYVGMNQFLQNPTNVSSEVRPVLHSLGFNPPLYAIDPGYMTSGNQMYRNMMPAGYFPQQYTIGGYGSNLPPVATGYLPNNPFLTPFDNMVPSLSGQSQTSGVNLQHLNNFYGHFALPPFLWEEHILCSLGGVGHINLNSRRIDTMNPYYIGSPTYMDFLQSPNSPFANSRLMPGSHVGESSDPGRRNESVYGGWKGHAGNHVVNDPKANLFLEELRSGKGRRLELSDIFGRVVEFSVDQYGSRFIQQKLEVCSNEERESIFKEVVPHAYKLTTDAFGNYVIQKIFEYGNDEQRRVFRHQLEGQVLPLSLHMYGCRVIQKALESIELEQKIKILHELDGHVLKCACDQNGNHVIQKCIEYLPTENIKIVMSCFRGQVVALSKHPYGCRVIQRVLEHSTEELQSQFIVDEILDCVYDLAQDQYGNYVTQYVLEGGKPEERSLIIHKLAGHLVRLSQHKYASNVIEKCLENGDEAARKMMIEEITRSAAGNDNILVMVKDQYANYVLQKVLQTCGGHQREVLLSRIKVHLNSLKNLTYGKHIVARFDQSYGEETVASSS